MTAPRGRAGRGASTRQSDRGADQQARRVAIVHHQTRPTLAVAAAFTFAAGVAAVVPHHTGLWLPLHLFLVGGLLTAISGVTQFLAVTWSAAPPPPQALVGTQRVLLAVGVLGLGIGRELGASPVFLGAAGFTVIASLVLLQVSLVRIRTTGKIDRFRPAIDGYLIAVSFGLVGCGAGIVLASGVAADRGDTLRSAHLIVNVFGLVGIVIAATLPYMVATQVRSKMAPRATPRALRSTTGLLTAATVLACTGVLWALPRVASLGFGLYALGIVATVSLCPRIQLRHLRWAGPRLGLVALGVLWWAGTTAGLAVTAGRGQAPPNRLLLALVIGGYAQILAGSLAYLAPVLRGGGHVRLTAGFTLTRSPLALAAANTAALGALTGTAVVTITGIAIWLADTAVRAGLLITVSKANPCGPPRIPPTRRGSCPSTRAATVTRPPISRRAAPMDDPMETVLDASARLRAAGYTTDLSAVPHGQLRCAACGATVDAASCTVVDLVRFEGESNPDDEAILMSLIAPCGHRGLFSCAYGQTTSADSTEVLRALPAHPALPPGGPPP